MHIILWLEYFMHLNHIAKIFDLSNKMNLIE
jgi:hypothetical protein